MTDTTPHDRDEDWRDELVSAYLDGEATPQERALVESSGELSARAAELRAVIDALAEAPEPAPPPDALDRALLAVRAELDANRAADRAADDDAAEPRRAEGAEVVELARRRGADAASPAGPATRRRSWRLPALAAAATLAVALVGASALRTGERNAESFSAAPPPATTSRAAEAESASAGAQMADDAKAAGTALGSPPSAPASASATIPTAAPAGVAAGALTDLGAHPTAADALAAARAALAAAPETLTDRSTTPAGAAAAACPGLGPGLAVFASARVAGRAVLALADAQRVVLLDPLGCAVLAASSR